MVQSSQIIIVNSTFITCLYHLVAHIEIHSELAEILVMNKKNTYL